MDTSLQGDAGTAPATHLVLSEDNRRVMSEMLDTLRRSLETTSPDNKVEDVLTRLVQMPGADSRDALRPLVKCLPWSIASRLPEILTAEGAAPKTAVLSYIGKDIMFRLDAAISYGSAFLALTDLECDSARQLRGY
jgi:hypothetical protein